MGIGERKKPRGARTNMNCCKISDQAQNNEASLNN